MQNLGKLGKAAIGQLMQNLGKLGKVLVDLCKFIKYIWANYL